MTTDTLVWRTLLYEWLRNSWLFGIESVDRNQIRFTYHGLTITVIVRSHHLVVEYRNLRGGHSWWFRLSAFDIIDPNKKPHERFKPITDHLNSDIQIYS
jgi:hypothetical protein